MNASLWSSHFNNSGTARHPYGVIAEHCNCNSLRTIILPPAYGISHPPPTPGSYGEGVTKRVPPARVFKICLTTSDTLSSLEAGSVGAATARERVINSEGRRA